MICDQKNKMCVFSCNQYVIFNFCFNQQQAYQKIVVNFAIILRRARSSRRFNINLENAAKRKDTQTLPWFNSNNYCAFSSDCQCWQNAICLTLNTYLIILHMAVVFKAVYFVLLNCQMNSRLALFLMYYKFNSNWTLLLFQAG